MAMSGGRALQVVATAMQWPWARKRAEVRELATVLRVETASLSTVNSAGLLEHL